MLERVRKMSFVAAVMALAAVSCSTSNESASSSPPAPAPASASPAPAPQEPTQIGIVRVSQSDCVLGLKNRQIEAGPVALTAVNQTGGPGGFDLWRIDGGATFEQFAAHIAKEKRLAQAGKPFLGPPSYVGDLTQLPLQGGERSNLVATVRPGTYAIVCARTFKQRGDIGVFALVGPMNVLASPTLTLSETGCAYNGPHRIPTGRLTIDVVNKTADDLYFSLASIDEGHSYDELLSADTEGPPPWATVVNDGQIGPGEVSELAGTLTSGTYGLLCARWHDESGSLVEAGVWTPGSFTVSG
jgi:hypothetical protein